jgi:hypothetical protein
MFTHSTAQYMQSSFPCVLLSDHAQHIDNVPPIHFNFEQFGIAVKRMRDFSLLPALPLDFDLELPELSNKIRIQWKECAKIIAAIKVAIKLLVKVKDDVLPIFGNLSILTHLQFKILPVTPSCSLELLIAQYKDALVIASNRYDTLSAILRTEVREQGLNYNIPIFVKPTQFTLSSSPLNGENFLIQNTSSVMFCDQESQCNEEVSLINNNQSCDKCIAKSTIEIQTSSLLSRELFSPIFKFKRSQVAATAAVSIYDKPLFQKNNSVYGRLTFEEKEDSIELNFRTGSPSGESSSSISSVSSSDSSSSDSSSDSSSSQSDTSESSTIAIKKKHAFKRKRTDNTVNKIIQKVENKEIKNIDTSLKIETVPLKKTDPKSRFINKLFRAKAKVFKEQPQYSDISSDDEPSPSPWKWIPVPTDPIEIAKLIED